MAKYRGSTPWKVRRGGGYAPTLAPPLLLEETIGRHRLIAPALLQALAVSFAANIKVLRCSSALEHFLSTKVTVVDNAVTVCQGE